MRIWLSIVVMAGTFAFAGPQCKKSGHKGQDSIQCLRRSKSDTIACPKGTRPDGIQCLKKSESDTTDCPWLKEDSSGTTLKQCPKSPKDGDEK